MKKIFPLLTTVLMLNGCVIQVNADEPLEAEQRQLQLSAAQLKQLVADTGAGNLQIIGEAGRQQIDVAATIYSRAKTEVELSLQARGDAALLVAKTSERFSIGNSPYIDLVVKVPASFNLKLDDGSGDTDIRGLTGDLVVNDGSGNLRIDGGKQLSVEDGSGDLQISNIAGNTQVDDGSGNMDIRHIGGDLTITDGSGDIRVSQVAGTVRIDDGSGDIQVEQAGSLIVEDGGSGDIRYQQISGKVELPDDEDHERQ